MKSKIKAKCQKCGIRGAIAWIGGKNLCRFCWNETHKLNLKKEVTK